MNNKSIIIDGGIKWYLYKYSKLRCSVKFKMAYIALIFVSLVAAAFAAPAADKEPIPILSQESEADSAGKFHYSYESGDGTKAEQDGELKQINKDEAAESVHGKYEYKGDDGKSYSVSYTADENGYQPHGEHIPEVPPLISRALAYLATAPPPKEEKP